MIKNQAEIKKLMAVDHDFNSFLKLLKFVNFSKCIKLQTKLKFLITNFYIINQVSHH